MITSALHWAGAHAPALLSLGVPAAQDPQKPDQHWQLPVKASSFATEHDQLYTFVEWINYVFFFGIMAVLFYSVVRYRRRREDQPPASTSTHNTAMEVTWTVIPLIVVMVIFALGWKGYAEMSLAPGDSLQFEVSARRWEWSFKHPGHDEFYTRELWVPVNRPCQLTMSSRDVLHSFYIPAFRVKRDVLPGRYQTLWFKPTMVGDYHIFCTEYCGDQHS
ncbi:MAG: cytochrome c oxidase subunit II, partial [Planctomycetes bacterium]|nr:cytochrome c oxidase subunit II [Planctomycetota bacterium]